MSSTFQLEFDEVLNILYFTEVENVKEVTEKLSATAYPFTNCTAINSHLILEPFQIVIAANKAVVSKNNNKMITKSVATELLFNLSISENITTSLERFGYTSNNDKTLLLVIFDNDKNKIKDILKEVQGILSPLSSLSEQHDLNLIKQIYEVTDEQLMCSSLINVIVTKIACKSI